MKEIDYVLLLSMQIVSDINVLNIFNTGSHQSITEAHKMSNKKLNRYKNSK